MNGTVLITGATSGIGLEMSKIFAFHGYDLVLVSRSKDKLKQTVCEIKKANNVNVYAVAQDLCEENAAQKIYDKVKELGISVDILINNAGAGYVGLFNEKPFEDDEMIIRLNMESLTQMTKLFSKDMAERRSGKILNVASTGSFAPGPYTAVYYASKAYVYSLSRALSIELESYGITVSVLCPGATKTNFAKNAGKRDTKIAMSASKVAYAAYKGLMKNKKLIIPGIRNKLFVLLPPSFVIRIVGIYQKKLLK